MSFSLGFYDVFSHLLPGLIYLYTINEFFKVLGWQNLKYADLTGGIPIETSSKHSLTDSYSNVWMRSQ